jgi:molecular chaperone HscB
MDFHATHFQLFGLPESYRLDLTSLEAAYRSLQNEVHPDRFAASGDAEKRLSMQWAAKVNEAYQTLKKPLGRAAYLLQLRGHEVFSAKHTAFPPAFLMQQMEWRESIAAARQVGDAAALDSLWRELRKGAAAVEERLAAELDDLKDDEAAANSARELKFMLKLIDEVGDAQEALDAA